ncbi:hypothetical protein [Arenibacter certesii]|uniref:Uncharacterized protein n=1 Tax=Arenibacter certesii TaxID=228955 RepID=A0A918ML89_9FLAO|nr:hypothetical protein [Arenibacter certesii]GGW37285.1 hypothetical protein GCM10007383_22680 [Arenibacter certesii]
MEPKNEMNNANKLLMIQGVHLIQNGIEFLDWMPDHKDANTYDALSILKDRFQHFMECAFKDGIHDHLIIDRMTGMSGNIQNGYEVRNEINKRLEGLRNIVRVQCQAQN